MAVGLISLVSWLLLSSSSAEAVNRYEEGGENFFWNSGKDAQLRYVRALDESSSSGVPPIRLVNGSTPLEGRVEIKLKGQWGTMCGKRADVFTAKVICRQLGYFGNAEMLEYAYFGQGSGPVWLQPSCKGDELSVDECPNFGWNRTVRCGEGSHQFDLAIVCGAAAAHSVRLVNGSSPAEGRIEVFYQGKWGTVCGTNATFDLAIVVCRQLGYRETVALKTNAYFGRGSGPVWLEPACYAGINSTVVDCIHAGWGETACDHSQDVGVICSETIPVRLVNGKRASEGRIELLHNGEWGTICNYYADINVGHVVCRELGYPGADRITTYAAFGEGKGHVLLAPKCIGNETTLLHCEHTGWGKYERHCDHSHDSGVICIDESLPTDKALSADSSSSLFASVLVPVILCCVVFNGVVVGATAYIISRRRRRRQNQRDTPKFGVLSPPSAENQKEISHEEVADEHDVEHPTTTDYLDDKDTEKFFYPDD